MKKLFISLCVSLFLITACKTREKAAIQDIAAADSFGIQARFQVRDGKLYKQVAKEHENRPEYLLFDQGQDIQAIQEVLLSEDSAFHSHAEKVYYSLSSDKYKDTKAYKNLAFKNETERENFDATRKALKNSFYTIQAFRDSLKRSKDKAGLIIEINNSFNNFVSMMQTEDLFNVQEIPNGNFIITMLDAAITAEGFLEDLDIPITPSEQTLDNLDEIQKTLTKLESELKKYSENYLQFRSAPDMSEIRRVIILDSIKSLEDLQNNITEGFKEYN